MAVCSRGAKKIVKRQRKLRMSFGGCGFLGVYHAGVGKCVVDHAPHLFEEFEHFYGASAGAITAVSAACKSDPMVAYKWVKKTFEASRKYTLGMFHPSFDLYARLRVFLEGFLPKNAHRRCRNRVLISLSVIGDKGIPTNWLITDFNTRRELIDAIIASSFIPGYAGFKDLPKIRGRRCFDGGFTSNIPCCFDADVITVSPFSGGCDICPQGESGCMQHVHFGDQPFQISSKNLYRLMKSLCPTSWEELEELFHHGYSDALRFFRQEGLISNPVIEPKTSKVSVAQPTTTSSETTVESISVGGDSGYLSHTHSRSDSLATVSTVTWFNTEEVEQDLEDDIGLIMKPASRKDLVSRIDELEEGAETEEDVGVACEDSQSLSVVSHVAKQPVRVIRSSLRGLCWLAHSCYLTQLPGLYRLTKVVDSSSSSQMLVVSKSHDQDTKNKLAWEKELSFPNGLVATMLSRWPGSMVIY